MANPRTSLIRSLGSPTRMRYKDLTGNSRKLRKAIGYAAMGEGARKSSRLPSSFAVDCDSFFVYGPAPNNQIGLSTSCVAFTVLLRKIGLLD